MAGDPGASPAHPDRANPDFVYLDSNFYLGFLIGDRPNGETLRLILEAWDRGEVQVATSALTIAEVLHLRRGDGQDRLRLPPEMQPRIDDLFRPSGRRRLLVVNVTRSLAKESRELVWDHGIEPKDAIHVRSALTVGAPVMFTSDRALLRKDRRVGGDPPLRIEEPRWVVQTSFLDRGDSKA